MPALAIALWIAERNVGAAWDALLEDDEDFHREHPYSSRTDFTGRGAFDPDEL